VLSVYRWWCANTSQLPTDYNSAYRGNQRSISPRRQRQRFALSQRLRGVLQKQLPGDCRSNEWIHPAGRYVREHSRHGAVRRRYQNDRVDSAKHTNDVRSVVNSDEQSIDVAGGELWVGERPVRRSVHQLETTNHHSAIWVSTSWLCAAGVQQHRHRLDLWLLISLEVFHVERFFKMYNFPSLWKISIRGFRPTCIKFGRQINSTNLSLFCVYNNAEKCITECHVYVVFYITILSLTMDKVL